MFLARDFIETHEGLLFAVTLNGVEEGRVIACLRYIREGNHYKKTPTEAASQLLKTHYPHYLYYSSKRDILLQAVPVEAIRHHIRPREALQALLKRTRPDPVTTKLTTLLGLFDENGLDSAYLGVTGSLLIGCHGIGSDIDLVVYGKSAFQQARSAVKTLLQQGILAEPDWRETYSRRGCSLSFEEYVWHERRKFNKGAIEGTKFDLILVEEKIQAPDPRPWRKIGLTTIQAQIIDDSESFATPACYRLNHPQIKTAFSFTATYIGQAKQGEWVEITGHLEQNPEGDLRLIVGASREAPEEYIKVNEARGGIYA